jgi:two-component system OmpR family sensor kinase
MSARGKRLVPTGLRWRLAGWVALVVMLCTAIVFVAVYRGTATQLRRQIDQEIAGDAGDFAHGFPTADARSYRELSGAATHYVRGQSFSHSPTLLFALVPGQSPSTNRPELFGTTAPDNGESAAEQALENRASGRLRSAPIGYSTLTLADVGQLRLLKRRLQVSGGRAITIGVGEPLAGVAQAQRGVARAFILAGFLALGGALLAAYVVGSRVSRPLRKMASVAARVDAGDLHHRIHDPGGQGDEVKVLADAFNHMLDRLAGAFAGQRAFVADASHELRTPLTVIRGQLEVLSAQDHPSSEEVRRVERLVQAEIARISRLVEDLLLLARTEQAELLRIEPIDLSGYVRELWDGVSLLANRRFELGEVPEGTLSADPDAIAQALRNLIANAIEHTAAPGGLVRLLVIPLAGERVCFVVEDDGPGIPVEQREHVFDRFHRTDPARDRASGGTGLGLAIVRAIVDAHGGSASVEEPLAAGARMVLELPGFTPAQSRRAQGVEGAVAEDDSDRAGLSSTGSAAAGPRSPQPRS